MRCPHCPRETLVKLGSRYDGLTHYACPNCSCEFVEEEGRPKLDFPDPDCVIQGLLKVREKYE
jgi:transposase-like protein